MDCYRLLMSTVACLKSQVSTCACISVLGPPVCSQNCGMVEVGRNIWRSPGPTSLIKQYLLELVIQDHVREALEHLQGGRLHNPTGQPVPELSHLHSEKAFPDSQTEPPMLQLVPIVSCPVTEHHWKDPGYILFSSSLQVFIYMGEMPPETFSRMNSPSSLSLSS